MEPAARVGEGCRWEIQTLGGQSAKCREEWGAKVINRSAKVNKGQ